MSVVPGLSQSLSIAPWGRECVNRRDIISWKLIFRRQRGLMVPSPSDTADPIGNISPLCNEFYKSGETGLILCEAPPAVLLSVNVISVPWSGTRNFIRGETLCAIRRCGPSRALLPAPPRRLDPQLSLASEAASLLNPFFFRICAVSCSQACFEPPKVELEPFGSEAKIHPSSSRCSSQMRGSPAVTL